MTPKEKANELMSKFVGISLSQVNELVDGIRIRLAKESALIAVDAILEHMMGNRAYDFKEKLFWREVKAELQSFQKTPNP